MKSYIIILIICALCISCSTSTIKYYPGGAVEHQNDLQEAFRNCQQLCVQEYGPEDAFMGPVFTERITQCTEQQCFCEC